MPARFLLADPNAAEEGASDSSCFCVSPNIDLLSASCTIVFNEHGHLCSVYKPGKPVFVTLTRLPFLGGVGLQHRQLTQCLDLAKVSREMLRCICMFAVSQRRTLDLAKVAVEKS